MIGIDGGGTKTESVLFDETGHILARDICSGANALDLPGGIGDVQELLFRAVERLMAKLSDGMGLDSIYAGLAGSVDWFPGVLDRELGPRLPATKVRFEGDGGNLIAAVHGHRDGCGLIAGTGSALYIRKGDVLTRYGGYGYLIDTQGSGYTIGRDAFLAAFRYYDGRGDETILYDLIREQMGKEPIECIPRIYQGGRAYIAGFAKTVFEGRKRGDTVSMRIFDHAVHCLAELVAMGERELGSEFTVVTGGGLFTAFPEYEEALRAQISPGVRLVEMDAPPIYGAAVEALWDAGVAETEEIKQQFMRDYIALRNGT